MWRNGKMCIAIIFGFFVLGQMGVFAQDATSDDAYCQTVSICGSAPKEFTLMMEFADEMLNTIRTVGTEGSYLGKYVSPDRFVGGTFTPPQQNIIGKAATNLGQKLDFVLATTAIFTSPQQGGGLADIFAGIFTLFKNKVFSRDLKRVEKLDSAITQKRYELGLGGGWGKTIRKENIAAFQKIITTYQTKGLLANNSRISSDAKYNNITAVMGSIDAGLKTFLSTDVADDLTNLMSVNGLTIIIKPEVIQSMQRQYDCAKGTKNICDATYKNFAKNMKSIGSGAADKVKKSIKTFGDAAKRLTEVFSSTPSADFAAREKELLNSYNGNQKMKTGINATIDNGSAFTQWRSATVDEQTQNVSAIDQARTTPVTTTTIPTQPFAQWMLERMAPLMDDQKRDLAQVNFSEVKDFSQYFDTLGQQLLSIKNVLGNKDKDGTLIKELGKACELQCGGLTKKCW